MELLLVSLRTVFGLPIARVQKYYSPSIQSFDSLFGRKELDMLVEEGLLVSDDDWSKLVATEKGRRLLDSLLVRLWSLYERKNKE